MNPLGLEPLPPDAPGAERWNEKVLTAWTAHEQKRRLWWWKQQKKACS